MPGDTRPSHHVNACHLADAPPCDPFVLSFWAVHTFVMVMHHSSRCTQTRVCTNAADVGMNSVYSRSWAWINWVRAEMLAIARLIEGA